MTNEHSQWSATRLSTEQLKCYSHSVNRANWHHLTLIRDFKSPWSRRTWFWLIQNKVHVANDQNNYDRDPNGLLLGPWQQNLTLNLLEKHRNTVDFGKHKNDDKISSTIYWNIIKHAREQNFQKVSFKVQRGKQS